MEVGSMPRTITYVGTVPGTRVLCLRERLRPSLRGRAPLESANSQLRDGVGRESLHFFAAGFFPGSGGYPVQNSHGCRRPADDFKVRAISNDRTPPSSSASTSPTFGRRSCQISADCHKNNHISNIKLFRGLKTLNSKALPRPSQRSSLFSNGML